MRVGDVQVGNTNCGFARQAAKSCATWRSHVDRMRGDYEYYPKPKRQFGLHGSGIFT
ncbi:hypothetical protein COCMIDRAFT_92677 [Bipolaris oryzae ATCC 44560]|uniref:Uncharacterized protein n=1 Tax=Bipolaris oryzae ATCC 44560 TaxID=930090 RepID=W6Z906_COCMI|nr:uncharacterized protein COCMIDRAFT_92677 [Bipolaris oryzae ATCC 44560]EUC46525.1 hypothetical protein COCMIDRAFT_92677 [Bipolaris oryzae ATCC 44560]